MSTKKKSYLNQMLEQLPKGVVATSVWLKSLGISNDLQQSYKHNGWLQSIGQGAFIRYNETPWLDGAIHTLQYQLHLKVHKGARTALEIHGLSHFPQLNHQGLRQSQLFMNDKSRLPKWFNQTLFQLESFNIFKTSFLPDNMGFNTINNMGVYQLISSPQRAILEELYLCPERASLKSAYQSLELMVQLNPSTFQELLENCNSVKVKRLFLYMAEKIGHAWFQFLDLSKIDLGSGKRVITKGGKLDKKYDIVIEDLESI